MFWPSYGASTHIAAPDSCTLIFVDYLPIEAMLELFANLLPSAKVAGGQEKRTQFIKQVFDTSDFPNYLEIVEILSSPVSDWALTSQRICDSLASVKPHL